MFYGRIVHYSTNCRELSSLECVATEAMRIVSGCFKTTPKINKQVITDKLSLIYYYRAEGFLHNPAFKFHHFRTGKNVIK